MSKDNEVFSKPWNSRFKPYSNTPPPQDPTPQQRQQADIRRRIEIILERQALEKEWR